MSRLAKFKQNTYSQNGEDGVIREILKRLGLVVNSDFWCVEFGAWDGIHLSNTFALVEAHSATAVMIEGDTDKFRALQQTAERFPTIIPVEALVTSNQVSGDSPVSNAFTGSFDPHKAATLDKILTKTSCPSDYDLLSIDIDTQDLEVWYAHNAFKPKIVVIEINSSLHPGILQWHGGGLVGNSFSSTVEVAKLKGYTLVCHTGNAVFVRDDLVNLLGLDELDIRFPERLFFKGWLPQYWSLSSNLSKQPILRLLQKAIRKGLGLSGY